MISRPEQLNATAIAELFVDPEAQGKGIGKALLSAAVDGRPSAWLITLPDSPAAALYRAMGWRQAGRLPTDPALTVFTLDRRGERASEGLTAGGADPKA